MRTNNNHLSENDFFQYHNMNLDSESMLRISNHMESCEDCKKKLKNFQLFSKKIYEAIKNDLSIEKPSGCLNDMDISAYLENRISSDDRNIIEKHLCECGYCLIVIVETKKFLEKEVKEDKSQISHEKIMRIVKQELRHKALTGHLTLLIKNGSPVIQNALEGIIHDIKDTLKDTFILPSPRFTPVFGKHKANILSPFGKIRYPITFEWLPYKGADQYVISIEATEWSFTTPDTHIEVLRKKLSLDFGKEYMWELKIIKGEKVIDEITGFFSLADLKEIGEIKEIENHINDIEPEEDKLLLFGEILEKKELFIEAIYKYKQSYAIQPFSGLTYRIAFCYDKLELEELRDEWNKKIEDNQGTGNE